MSLCFAKRKTAANARQTIHGVHIYSAVCSMGFIPSPSLHSCVSSSSAASAHVVIGYSVATRTREQATTRPNRPRSPGDAVDCFYPICGVSTIAVSFAVSSIRAADISSPNCAVEVYERLAVFAVTDTSVTANHTCSLYARSQMPHAVAAACARTPNTIVRQLIPAAGVGLALRPVSSVCSPCLHPPVLLQCHTTYSNHCCTHAWRENVTLLS